MNEQQPRFKHDCERCHFVGRDDEVDVYVHATILEAGRLKVTVVRRFSNEGHDYRAKEMFT